MYRIKMKHTFNARRVTLLMTDGPKCEAKPGDILTLDDDIKWKVTDVVRQKMTLGNIKRLHAALERERELVPDDLIIDWNYRVSVLELRRIETALLG